MVGIAIIVAMIFIGGYFYKSASSIGKNGFLWLGIALGTFIMTMIFISLILQFFLNGMLAVLIGLFSGLFSLAGVNYYMNIIPD